MKLKALSLWQPWASLVINGAKRFETRSWATAYRGPLVIHASRRWTREQRKLWATEPFHSALGAIEELPLGVALGLVDLVEILPVEVVVRRMTVQEQAFGDYSKGRFAWKLANPRPFPQPIPVRGYQGLWYLNYEVGNL